MPSSPPTPTRQGKTSSVGVQLSTSTGRRSSQFSLRSPSTSPPVFSPSRSGYFESSNGLDGPLELGNAHTPGNLADELADALDDDEKNEHRLRDRVLEGPYDRTEVIRHDLKENGCQLLKDGTQNRHAISIPPVRQATSELSANPPKPLLHPDHARKSSQYDGSDYGDDSDLEFTPFPLLEARLAAVETLARGGTEANGSDADEIVQRMTKSLRDLGSQTGVEDGTARLITAQTALTTHVSHQTRTLSTLMHPLVSPLSALPDLEFIDDLLPLLASLVRALPTTTSHALSSLHSLHASTLDLISVLSYLSDTLHVMRQTTSLASRKLRAAQEIVIRMQRETEARETGILWVENGDWEGRLAGRECAKVCGEVVGGFEEMCASWRRRLIAGVEVGAA